MFNPANNGQNGNNPSDYFDLWEGFDIPSGLKIPFSLLVNTHLKTQLFLTILTCLAIWVKV